MKKLFRTGVWLVLFGGWTAAASMSHVVRTPGSFLSGFHVVTKDRPTFVDTYVDTRKWTLTDDTAHADVVARLVHLGQADWLSHTVDPSAGTPASQLAPIAAGAPTTQPTPVEQAKAKFNEGLKDLKTKL